MQTFRSTPAVSDTSTADCEINSFDFPVAISFLLTALFPDNAWAADASSFSGVTDFLHSIANLLIMEWGYYIGIITLAIQGYRWKTGRIDLMELGGWGLGIGLVFFAPNIVSDLRSHAGSIA